MKSPALLMFVAMTGLFIARPGAGNAVGKDIQPTLNDAVLSAHAFYGDNKLDAAYSILVAALENPKLANDSNSIVDAEWYLGNIENRRGNVVSSLQHYRKAVAIGDADPKVPLARRLGPRIGMVNIFRDQGKRALATATLGEIENLLTQQLGAGWQSAPLAPRVPAAVRYYAYVVLNERAWAAEQNGDFVGALAGFSAVAKKLEAEIPSDRRREETENVGTATAESNLVDLLRFVYANIAAALEWMDATDEAIRFQKKAIALPYLRHDLGDQALKKFDLLGFRKNQDGPTDEIMREYEAVLKEWQRANNAHASLSVKMMKAELLNDRGQKQEARSIIDPLIREARLGGHRQFLASALKFSAEIRTTKKDAAIALQEIADALAIERENGNKIAEPALLRLYARALSKLGRHAEAVETWRQGVQLAKLLKNDGMLLWILIGLGEAQQEAGAAGAATQTWEQIDRFVMQHPQLSNPALLNWRLAKLEYLRSRGLETEARAAYADAKTWLAKTGLSAWQARELANFDFAAPVDIAATPLKEQPLDLQPLAMSSDAGEDGRARGRFTLVNPNEWGVQKAVIVRSDNFTATWSETEAGLVARMEPAPRGGASAQAVTLVAHEELAIYLEANSVGEEGGSATIESGDTKRTWEFSPGAKSGSVEVVDANLASQSPFYAVSLYHAIRGAENTVANIRVQTSQPCRVEFVDEKTNTLLAIDAQGRGDFQNSGDVLSHDADGDGFPDVRLGENGAAIELRVYPPESAYTAGKRIEITVSAKTENGWEPQAVDTLELRAAR